MYNGWEEEEMHFNEEMTWKAIMHKFIYTIVN